MYRIFVRIKNKIINQFELTKYKLTNNVSFLSIGIKYHYKMFIFWLLNIFMVIINNFIELVKSTDFLFSKLHTTY